MERVTNIVNLPTPAPKIDEDGIAMLERWIELLKSGEVTAIAICGISPTGSSTSYSGAPSEMLGPVVMLQHRITLAMYS